MRSVAGRVFGLAVVLLAVSVLFGGGLAVSLRHVLTDRQPGPQATWTVPAPRAPAGPVHLLPFTAPLSVPVRPPRPAAP